MLITDPHPRSYRPTQAFIAGGKLGADQMSQQRTDGAGREAALATLVAGQKAENVRLISAVACTDFETNL